MDPIETIAEPWRLGATLAFEVLVVAALLFVARRNKRALAVLAVVAVLVLGLEALLYDALVAPAEVATPTYLEQSQGNRHFSAFYVSSWSPRLRMQRLSAVVLSRRPNLNVIVGRRGFDLRLLPSDRLLSGCERVFLELPSGEVLETDGFVYRLLASARVEIRNAEGPESPFWLDNYLRQLAKTANDEALSRFVEAQ